MLYFLSKFEPNDIGLIVIDRGGLEYNAYNDVPHLLLPTLANDSKIEIALNWIVREALRRRNILSDNTLMNNAKLFSEIFILIDDYNFIYTNKQIYNLINEILMHSKYSGINVIASANILDSKIDYSDFDCRIAFNIEDNFTYNKLFNINKSESLSDYEIIFKTIATTQKCSISLADFDCIDNIIEEWKNQNKAELHLYKKLQTYYKSDVTADDMINLKNIILDCADDDYDKLSTETVPNDNEDRDDNYDEKWDEAIAVVAETRQASGSMLQRRLGVGFNRAMKMIERMEKEGIVGPSMGDSRPREVFLGRIPKN